MKKTWENIINKYSQFKEPFFEIEEKDYTVFKEMASFIMNYMPEDKFYSNFQLKGSDFRDQHILDIDELNYISNTLKNIDNLRIH